MTSTPIAIDPGFEPIELPDADIAYLPRCSLPLPPVVLLERLIDETPWRAETITMFGRKMPQPRLIAWYGDSGTTYRYSGLSLEALGWTPLLAGLRDAIEKACGTAFNGVLVNYYRDHRDSMGMHSDDEPELGPEPTIASLSLGEPRPFVLRSKKRRELPAHRIVLASGSLLLMRGVTQQHWKHGIDKLSRPCGPRVNLTFRRVVGRMRPAAGTAARSAQRR